MVASLLICQRCERYFSGRRWLRVPARLIGEKPTVVMEEVEDEWGCTQLSRIHFRMNRHVKPVHTCPFYLEHVLLEGEKSW